MVGCHHLGNRDKIAAGVDNHTVADFNMALHLKPFCASQRSRFIEDGFVWFITSSGINGPISSPAKIENSTAARNENKKPINKIGMYISCT